MLYSIFDPFKRDAGQTPGQTIDGDGIRKGHHSAMPVCAQEAEPHIVVAVGRRVVVAIGNPHVPGVVVPAATAYHPVGAAFWRLP